MGVPAFFRWLSRKYPSIVVPVEEEKPRIVGGQALPIDSSKPNPNNIEFDNLYLDMNGIIHPCCHPENRPAPKNEDEMMVLIFEYIDRLFAIIRPRRLLYMAIDGVAPRAKLNQQRSRRFRGSKELTEKVDAIQGMREKLFSRGMSLPPEKSKEEHFDNNCITPGTPFMDRLATALHYYIHERLNSDPGWRNIQVILSDANVPGEGEHKIMDYIRKQRASPNHDPNTHHCLCGADADLIMLGLATHEPNFTIIREEFKPNQPRACDLCGQFGHELKECQGMPKEKTGKFDELEKPMGAQTDFIFLRLPVLREYLAVELRMDGLPFTYDFERCLDDWVFMCFFVGNDFLPHLPSLEIREGAIDRLVSLYKKTVYRTGGYLTDNGKVNLSRVQLIMTELGEVEDQIFKQRQDREVMFKQREKQKKQQNKRSRSFTDRPAWTPGGQFAPRAIGDSQGPISNAREEGFNSRRQAMEHHSNLEAAEALKSMLRGGSSGDHSNHSRSKSSGGEKRKYGEDSDSDEEPPDDVRLWEDGCKGRYYQSKFEVMEDNYEFRNKVALEYTLGLCWVLAYYYQGCPSWKWFFPYHYAPFASDFINIGDMDNSFEKGTQPFNPMEQLMSVFPAASRSHLPPAFGDLMTDPESEIIDFYPDDFRIDLNGKKFAWQGVALLPFVDEVRLLETLKKVYPTLTEEEKKRNSRGDDRLYIHKQHKGYNYLLGFYEGKGSLKEVFDLSPELFYGMSGKALLSSMVVAPGDSLESPVDGLEAIQENSSVCIRFRDPIYPDDFIFPAIRLPGAIEPNRVLKPGDYHQREFSGDNRRPWRPQIGMAPSNNRASLDGSGFRKLNHSLNQGGGGQYNNIPPPNSYSTRGGRNTPYGGGDPRVRQQQGGSNYDHYQAQRPYGHNMMQNPHETGRNQYNNSQQQQQQPQGHWGRVVSQPYGPGDYQDAGGDRRWNSNRGRQQQNRNQGHWRGGR